MHQQLHYEKARGEETDLAPRIILMLVTPSQPILAQHSRTYASSIQTSKSPRCKLALSNLPSPPAASACACP